MKNLLTFNLALFLLFVAFLGTGMRQFENGNFLAVAVSGIAMAAIGVVSIIRIRNYADAKAVNKG